MLDIITRGQDQQNISHWFSHSLILSISLNYKSAKNRDTNGGKKVNRGNGEKESFSLTAPRIVNVEKGAEETHLFYSGES